MRSMSTPNKNNKNKNTSEPMPNMRASEKAMTIMYVTDMLVTYAEAHTSPYDEKMTKAIYRSTIEKFAEKISR